MRLVTLPIALLLISFAFAGCIGNADPFGFEPGKDYKETGNTVHLRMWVEDLFQDEIYPGFKANLWAFCAEPMNADDTYSAQAIEHFAEPPGAGDVGGFGNGPDERCSSPGPTLRVQQGDRIKVEFENDHFHCHTIHWHGQFVPWRSDGVQGATQDSTCEGGSYTYDFVAAKAGTLWYHCHVDVQLHVMQGLFGVIIVEPQDTEHEPKDIDKEYVLVYSTLRRRLVETVPGDTNPHDDHGAQCGGTSGTPECQNPAVDTTPDTWLLNGRSAPHSMHQGEEVALANGAVRDTGSLITIEPGERVRLRILNAGGTFETLHPHGHDVLVTHRDGSPLHPDARFYVDTLTIGPAERYDVVLEGRTDPDAAGLWMFHTHVEHHVTNDGQSPGGAMTMIVYPGFEDDLQPFAAEAMGGRPYKAPVDLPDDLARSTRLSLGSGETQDTWEFPVDQEMPCAVKTISFSATAQSLASSMGLGLPTSEVLVRVIDPDGEEAARMELSDTDRHGEWLWERDTDAEPHVELTKGGGYQVLVSGASTLEAEVDLRVFVDYDDNEAELLEERACGYGLGGHAH